ncbi:MAG TPA: geranylgeranylglycerol-phosphate geranylgeranyltransferase [Bacteroidales bacterium]|nr:geranylgeranylglycerol-phosphate geranylgeranyltransferase [Bacteroidales bacterium]
MKYLNLIRWPNLMIMLFTMMLLRHMVIVPRLALAGIDPNTNNLVFFLYALSTLLIAAGGYIVNDIMDIDVDRVNKPDKMIVTKTVSMSMAEKLYYGLTIAGSITGIAIGLLVSNWMLGLVFPVVAGAMWFYSKRYKRMLLIGNLVVSFSTAILLVLVWVVEFFALSNQPESFTHAISVMPEITGFVIAYALFALLATMLREIIKDIEDMEGDAKGGCRTFPVMYGMQPAKNLCIALLTTLIIMIGFWQYILYFQHYTQAMIFLFLALALSILLLLRLALASLPVHFSQASLLTKLLMLAGILSLIFVLPNA